VIDWDAEFAAQAEQEGRAYKADTPALEQKKREEFERGVRLGWWTADGVLIEQEQDEDEESEE
jgi:hypothetical protein